MTANLKTGLGWGIIAAIVSATITAGMSPLAGASVMHAEKLAIPQTASGLPVQLSGMHSSLPTNGQQLRFIDDRGGVESFQIAGTNQNGVRSARCVDTTGTSKGTKTDVNGWWWVGRTDVTLWDSPGCRKNYIGKEYFDAGAFPTHWSDWRCLEDVAPFKDYDC